MQFLAKYDFWSAVIGFLGVLTPLMWNLWQEKIMRKKISIIDNEVKIANERERQLAQTNALVKINMLEKEASKKSNNLNRIVFIILTIAFALQLIGVVKNG